ncbi:MAG TPA: GxxExxY protein, partial [Chthoniobacterales bacterium]|nr:GxxExxY protein [Chthoniobacterales bacterium]
KGKKLKTHYRSDFVCYDDIMVELKALARLGDGDLAQVLNYLKASRHRRAVLMNFGSKSLTTRAACMVAQCRLIQIRIWGPPKSAQCLIEGPSLVVTTPRDRA